MDASNTKNSPPRSPFRNINHSILTDFLYGSAAGLIGRGVIYPLENLQKMVSERSFFKPFQRTEAYFQAIPKIRQEEGISAIFKGWVPASIRYSLKLGSTLAFFYQFKDILYPKETYPKRDINMKPNIVCGGLASLAGYLVFQPIIEYSKLHVPIKQAKDIIQKDSFAQVYRFWSSDIPKALIRRGLLIGLYESKINRQYLVMRGKVPMFMKFVDAYSLALFSGFLSYPFQKRKERLIENLGKPEPIDEAAKVNRLGFHPLLKGISSIFVTQFSTALALTIFYTILENNHNQRQVY